MNIKKVMVVLSLAVLLWWGTIVSAFAENRNIYVGDIITLQVTSDFSREELQERFKDFEIVEIKGESYGYLISLRTFNVGEYSILLEDKEVVINVSSTLEDLQNDGVFEGEQGIIESIFFFGWSTIFYIITGAFFIIGSFIIVKAFARRKIKIKSPYELFLKSVNSISKEDDNYFVLLTLHFKEYVERRYRCEIKGKTTDEILNEIKKLQALNTVIIKIQGWLKECDRFKFTGTQASSEEKQKHYEELLALVGEIDKSELTAEVMA